MRIPRSAFAALGLCLAWGALAAPRAPVFRDVTVHDPSVVRDGDWFYVFGSHLAAAKTKDWMRWDHVAEGTRPDNPLFRDVTRDLAETFEWAQVTALWAPDVVRLKDGRYAMYYDACKGDSPRSALGLATSKKIEGPYRDEGILLKSGMWGQPGEDGDIYDARVHPNTVDPAVFTDNRGDMWMVYGSYSGGIFILKMDPKTGKPLPGQGYGKRLTGGNHGRIEAPYILYNPETKFYYLYVSFGGLDARGGYNIRVARSLHPDGPYRDSDGHPMANVRANADRPLFDDRSIEPYGAKLMGSFVFDRGDEDASDDHGYVSPGHNSAYYDKSKKRTFLVFHTRFPGRGEMHPVRVHPVFMNASGWPVVAPFRYAGETDDKVRAKEVPGDYLLVNHGKAITAEVQRSRRVRLGADGTVSGAAKGTWELTGRNLAILVLDGARYDGVFARQWDPDAKAWVMALTALSRSGVSVWAARLP